MPRKFLRFIIKVVLLLVLIWPVQIMALDLWQSDLRLGSRGLEVRRLQEFLNQSPATQVAISGPGSPGQETQYFGQRTRQAVIRLQNLYADEILQPLGLRQGTGVVGVSTRNFLNRQVLAQATPPPDSVDSANLKDSPDIESVSDELGQIIDQDDKLESLALNIPLSLENLAGQKVVLERLEPARGPAGSQITIYGQNFSSSNNTVYTGLSVLRNISSKDGSRLTINIDDLNLAPMSEPTQSFVIPLWIYVQNQFGISNNLIFNLIIE